MPTSRDAGPLSVEVQALLAEWDDLQDARQSAAVAAHAARHAARTLALRRHRRNTRLLAAAAVVQAAAGSVALTSVSHAHGTRTLAPETLAADVSGGDDGGTGANRDAPASPAGSILDRATLHLLALMGMPLEPDDQARSSTRTAATIDGDPLQAVAGLDAMLDTGPVEPTARVAAPADTDAGPQAVPTPRAVGRHAGIERVALPGDAAAANAPTGLGRLVELGAPVSGSDRLASTNGAGAPSDPVSAAGATATAGVGLAAGTGNSGGSSAGDDMAARLGGVLVASTQLEELRGGFESTENGQALRIRFGIERSVYLNGDLVATRTIGMDNLSAADGGGFGAMVRGYGVTATLPPSLSSAASNALVIQNALNDQRLHSQTVVNAVVESSGLLRATRLDSIMRDVSSSSLLR